MSESRPLSVEDLIEFLKSKERSDAERDPGIRDSENLVGKVQRFLELPADFQPGDIVMWKEGLKNKKYPGENQFAVVIQQLEEPLIQMERDSGTPYCREPLDLMLALSDNDGDLVVFYYDKRRFKIVQKNGARLSEEVVRRLTSKKI
jgi:hypothetical protein